MPIRLHSEFHFGDIVVRYQAPDSNPESLGFSLVPAPRISAVVAPRDHLDDPVIRNLPARWQPVTAWEVAPLVQVQLQRTPYPGAFSGGRSLQATAQNPFRFREQQRSEQGDRTMIRTALATDEHLVAVHELAHEAGDACLSVRTTLRNDGEQPVTVQLLTSFCLGGITPFAADEASHRLWLHRFRSVWSAEGRLESCLLEDLNLERSWVGHGVRAERFGQVGSLPANGYLPLCFVEDRAAGVFWGASLAHPGSWQFEVRRRADQVSLAGGLADREFGHWWKTLAPGESFTTPTATLTVGLGSIEDTCARLQSPVRRARLLQPAVDQSLPVIFNEWCTSWGSPTHDNLIALADRLRGSGVRYLVIDDGWAERPDDGIQQNGDWLVNRTAFPQGLRATTEAIRQRGLIPGLWFEFEVVTPGSLAWHATSHQLHRDGVPLQVGTRRFWDFRDPWVHQYLEARVISLLRENNFGYLKVDYNDSIGLGCDGAESPGEGLRQHLEGVQRFFQRLRTALPELVIENCSSGGHRAEPSMIALTAMTSFSDAHETPDLPVIAANQLAVLPSAQNQIWAVLRRDDDRARLAYSLAATFLGRMCLSGDAHTLSHEAWEFVRDAIALHGELAPLIAQASFRRHSATSSSYRQLTGWQAVVFHSRSDAATIVVWHTFAAPPAHIEIRDIDAQRVERHFVADAPALALSASRLRIDSAPPWQGGVVVLR